MGGELRGSWFRLTPQSAVQAVEDVTAEEQGYPHRLITQTQIFMGCFLIYQVLSCAFLN